MLRDALHWHARPTITKPQHPRSAQYDKRSRWRSVFHVPVWFEFSRVFAWFTSPQLLMCLLCAQQEQAHQLPVHAPTPPQELSPCDVVAQAAPAPSTTTKPKQIATSPRTASLPAIVRWPIRQGCEGQLRQAAEVPRRAGPSQPPAWERPCGASEGGGCCEGDATWIVECAATTP